MLLQFSNRSPGKKERTDKRPHCYYLNIAVNQTEFFCWLCTVCACLRGIHRKDKHQVICLNSVLTLSKWIRVGHSVWLSQGWKTRSWSLTFSPLQPSIHCVFGDKAFWAENLVNFHLMQKFEICGDLLTPICHQGKILSHRKFTFINPLRS
jgi:hypothetical protein